MANKFHCRQCKDYEPANGDRRARGGRCWAPAQVSHQCPRCARSDGYKHFVGMEITCDHCMKRYVIEPKAFVSPAAPACLSGFRLRGQRSLSEIAQTELALGCG